MKERNDTHLDKLADLLENLFLAGLGSENVVELERVAFDLSGSAGSAFCRKKTTMKWWWHKWLSETICLGMPGLNAGRT